MTATEISSAFSEIGFRGRLGKRAAALHARGVTRQDILAVYQHLRDHDGHGPVQARQVLDTMLDDEIEWGARVQLARQHHPSAGERLRGPAGRNTAHDERMREYQQMHHMTLAEAREYEAGGYIHEGMVGDQRDPRDLADEHGVDAWEAVQRASSWAQRMGGGTGPLRLHLERRARYFRDVARQERDPARQRQAHEDATRYEHYLAGVPEPAHDGPGSHDRRGGDHPTTDAEIARQRASQAARDRGVSMDGATGPFSGGVP